MSRVNKALLWLFNPSIRRTYSFKAGVGNIRPAKLFFVLTLLPFNDLPTLKNRGYQPRCCKEVVGVSSIIDFTFLYMYDR